MKKYYLQGICLLLSLVMVLSVLVGCSRRNKDGSGTTENSQQTESSTEPIVKKEMTFEDFGEREFNLMGRAGRTHYLYSDGVSPDRIEQAAYSRNSYIEENFHIDLILVNGPTGSTSGKTGEAWSNALITSSGEYDLIVPDYWWKIEQTGYVENLLDLPRHEIDLSDEWWYDGWNSSTTINGKLFSIVGDAAMEVLENIEVSFFNKNMAANNGLNLYADVEEGTWTLEQMRAYSRMVALNLDEPGDTTIYGSLYDQHSAIAQGYASGLKLININESGFPEANYNNPNNYDIIAKVASVIAEPSVNYEPKTARSVTFNINTFMNGRALFYNTALYLGTRLKNGNLPFDYGVIPMPKYNEEQADYISTIYGVSFFSIPTSVKDVHCSATILNALNWLSHPNGNLAKKSLTYEYLETVLKNQIADDEIDANMIQLARTNLYVDFAFIYDGNLKVHNAYDYVARGTNPDLASQLQTIDETFSEKLRELVGDIYG